MINMKYIACFLVFITVGFISAHALADVVAGPSGLFWEGECGVSAYFNYEECVSSYEKIDINKQSCLFVPEQNEYYMVWLVTEKLSFGTDLRKNQIKSEDILVVTNQCHYLSQFAKKHTTSLNLFNQIFNNIISVREQTCEYAGDERLNQWCKSCNHTMMSSYCFYVGVNERLKQECREAQMCIDNYKNRNIFW